MKFAASILFLTAAGLAISQPRAIDPTNSVMTARLKQSEFGIKPVKAGGGAVRVKDAVQIEFTIQLARR